MTTCAICNLRDAEPDSDTCVTCRVRVLMDLHAGFKKRKWSGYGSRRRQKPTLPPEPLPRHAVPLWEVE